MRAISSDLHMDYTAVGQTTHLAARMEQLASPGTTLLTADTLRLAEGYVEVKPLGAMPVKGLADAGRGLRADGGRAPALAALRGGRAGAHALRGPGRGARAASRGARARGERARPGGRDRGRAGCREVAARLGGHPLPPDPRLADPPGWLRLLRQGHAATSRWSTSSRATSRSPTGTSPAPSGRRSRASSSRSTAPWSPRSRRSSRSSTCRWRTAGGQLLDPPQRRQRTLDALKRLLLRESQVQPLLVVFEDLHWIDAETQAVLDRLVESLPTARLLLLVNYRPEYRHDWGGKTYYRQLRLDPSRQRMRRRCWRLCSAARQGSSP